MSESTTETARAVYGKPLFPVVILAAHAKKGKAVTITTKEGKEHERVIDRVLFTEDHDGQKVAYVLVKRAA